MPEEKTVPILQEIAAYQWEAVASTATRPICQEIATCLFSEANALEQSGDHLGGKVYRFLGGIAFMMLDPNNDDAPLCPAFQMATSRSASLQDYTPEALDIVASLATSTKISALCARFSDLLWILRKDHKAAQIASQNYLITFQTIEASGHWAWDEKGIVRGMKIASDLGRKKPLFLSYVKYIEGRLQALESTATDALCVHLLTLLESYRAGNITDAARVAESIGSRMDTGNNGFLARQYYDLAGQFLHMLNDLPAVQKIWLKKGESLVQEAKGSLKRQAGILAATHHLAVAIKCFEQGKDSKTHLQQLRKTLRDWQTKARGELKQIPYEIDISKIVVSAQKHVRGRSLQDAVFAMAVVHPVVSAAAIRKRVIENAEKFPIATLFPASMMSRDGRVQAHRPGGLSKNEQENLKFVETEMFHQAAQSDWPIRAQGFIDVCRREIWIEHRPGVQELKFLVLQNPFVPPGHEMLFLKGIAAGFRGDFDIAAYLLVPQIEESIRHILAAAGHDTSKINQQLIQDQRLLGTLLAMPETINLFGEDQVFEMRGLLVEKFGYDLRNRLAHGFLTHGECWGVDVINVWWLVLRFLCIPISGRLYPAASPAKKIPSDT